MIVHGTWKQKLEWHVVATNEKSSATLGKRMKTRFELETIKNHTNVKYHEPLRHRIQLLSFF
jgi:hypothetical protein